MALPCPLIKYTKKDDPVDRPYVNFIMCIFHNGRIKIRPYETNILISSHHSSSNLLGARSLGISLSQIIFQILPRVLRLNPLI